MKILNLYAGIGGNRKLWNDEHDITSVEDDPVTASVYRDFFPGDKVIMADAHQYLLDNYKSYDCIWSSPPCPSHSQLRYKLCMRSPSSHQKPSKPLYPDMRLYAEILFLQHYAEDVFWLVENVRPYYSPLIAPDVALGRHIAWCNFPCPEFKLPKTKNFKSKTIGDFEQESGFDLSGYEINSYKKRQILRNLVHPAIGMHVLDSISTWSSSSECQSKTCN